MTRAGAAATIAARELRALLKTPGGLIVLATFWLVAGLLLVSLLFRYREGMLAVAQQAGIRTQDLGAHVNDWVIRPLLYNLGTVLVLFVPLLTMRTFAEERRTGNLELLMSQPIRGADLVLGKFVGSVYCLAACLAVLVLHLLLLGIVSSPDWGATLVGLLGLLLLGFLFVAVGILISVLSRSQIEAGVLTLGALLLLVVGPGGNSSGPTWASGLLNLVAVLTRFEDFTRGVLDLSHITFFLGATLFLLALALRGLDLVRWQG